MNRAKIVDIELFIPENSYNNMRLVRCLLDNDSYVYYDVKHLLKILELWIVGEEEIYKPENGCLGRWMLFEKICEVFGYNNFEMEECKMDIKEELQKVREYKGKDYFKPKQGRYTVVFLGDPEEDVFIDESGKSNDVIKFKVEVTTKKTVGKPTMCIWTIPRGNSVTSLWGQLLTVADAKGTFNGLVVNITVTGEDKSKRYSVDEYLDMIDEESCTDD